MGPIKKKKKKKKLKEKIYRTIRRRRRRILKKKKKIINKTYLEIFQLEGSLQHSLTKLINTLKIYDS